MSGKPKNGIQKRQAITVRLPADLVGKLKKLGMTETIETAAVEYLKRTDTAMIEIKPELIDETVAHHINTDWDEIITSPVMWSPDLSDSESSMDLVADDIRNQLNEFEIDDEFEEDRIYSEYLDRATRSAQKKLDARIEMVRKGIDALREKYA